MVLALAGCNGVYARQGAQIVARPDSRIGVHLVSVSEPPKMREALAAIEAGLTAIAPDWFERFDLAVEWLPYGAIVTGPYIATGFVTRGPETRAVAPPVPPVSDATVDSVARVVGTVRVVYPYARPLPGKPRCTAIVMDGRVGASRREVLLGEGGDKPRADAGASALFYEVAWRIAPACLDGIAFTDTGDHAARYRALEQSMRDAYRR